MITIAGSITIGGDYWSTGGKPPDAAGRACRNLRGCSRPRPGATPVPVCPKPRHSGERGGPPRGGTHVDSEHRPAAPALVATGRADARRRRPSALDAGPAELLVRRGLHAGARPAPQPVGDAARDRAHREHATAVVPAGVGRLARAGHGRGGAAPARCAGGDRGRSRRLGDRTGTGGASGGAGVRRARGGQPAVRLVLAGGARIRAVRAHGRAGDALLPARPAGAHARAHGGPRVDGLAGDAQPLLRRLPAHPDGALAAVGTTHPNARAAGCRDVHAGRGGAGAAGVGPGGPEYAVDRRMGTLGTAAGDPPVLPDRLLGRAAWTQGRAARRTADPCWPRPRPVANARAPAVAARGAAAAVDRGVWSPDPDPAGGVRRRLSRATQPRRSDDSAHRPDRGDGRLAGDGTRRDRDRRGYRDRLPRGLDRRRSEGEPAT